MFKISFIILSIYSLDINIPTQIQNLFSLLFQMYDFLLISPFFFGGYILRPMVHQYLLRPTVSNIYWDQWCINIYWDQRSLISTETNGALILTETNSINHLYAIILDWDQLLCRIIRASTYTYISNIYPDQRLCDTIRSHLVRPHVRVQSLIRALESFSCLPKPTFMW